MRGLHYLLAASLYVVVLEQGEGSFSVGVVADAAMLGDDRPNAVERGRIIAEGMHAECENADGSYANAEEQETPNA